jgi:hypothetical protein
MAESGDPDIEAEEFSDDASYAWWRNSHPDGYVLALRARHPPVLHRASCRDVDRDRRPGRLKAKGSRQICADRKATLREWMSREFPLVTQLLARCPKCSP